MTQPLVSVIIPCYNYGKYVVKAIDSALNNTYKNIEIIVVNDCSTDPYTNEVLSKLNKPKTRVINHLENKGLPATRNTGIAGSKGKYIVPLDADDTLHPQFIEKTVQVLENNPNLGYVSTGIRYFGEQNFSHVPPTYNFYKLLFENINSVTSTFRKIAWEQVGGYNDNMRDGYEDWDFWISLGEKDWFGHRIEDVLFNYRKHGKSMITESIKKHDMLVQRIRNNHPELYKPEKLKSLRIKWDRYSQVLERQVQSRTIYNNRDNRNKQKYPGIAPLGLLFRKE